MKIWIINLLLLIICALGGGYVFLWQKIKAPSNVVEFKSALQLYGINDIVSRSNPIKIRDGTVGTIEQLYYGKDFLAFYIKAENGVEGLLPYPIQDIDLICLNDIRPGSSDYFCK